ncbi:MAG: DUF4367 domain-containing protein [Oscillospiraceae bacterium]
MKNFNKNTLNNLTVNELENLLNKELKKPAMLINSELVENLTDTLCAKEGLDITPTTDEEISKMVQNIINNEGKIVRKKQSNICKIAACVATLLIGLNTYTVSAYNENIFSFAIQYMKGGVLVNFNKEQEETKISLSLSSDDPYGIKAQLEEVGLENFEIPYYLPDGFVLNEFEHDDNNLRNYLCFVFRNGKQLINLTFEEYHNENQVPENIGIPSDEYNISEIEICGHTAVMSREDNQMNVLCAYGKKEFGIFTQDVPYDECDKILNSYK